MYIGEYLLWSGNSIKKETRKKLEMSHSSSDMKLSEVEKDWTKESVSNNPRAIGPYYAYNDRYLDIRGGMFENFRGIVTWISLLIFFIPLTSGFNFIYSIRVLFNNQTDEIGGYVITLIFFGIICFISLYLCIRYFRYVYRLELFTIRHIRVRFNRVTRQVYIQRPKYCGGTVVFKWDHIMLGNQSG